MLLNLFLHPQPNHDLVHSKLSWQFHTDISQVPTIFFCGNFIFRACSSHKRSDDSLADSHLLLLNCEISSQWQAARRRRASTFHEGDSRDESPSPRWRKRGGSFHEIRFPSNFNLENADRNLGKKAEYC